MLLQQETFSELGLSYHWQALRAGGDPSLFLDFRPVRRLLAAEAAGKDVLNLFSYTCGAGVAALAGGAASVVNVDHSAAYLAAGKRNTALNAAAWEGRTPTVENIAQDFYTAARQMAGIGIKGRASRGRRNASFPKLPRRDFDLVVLDPPTLTKSAFGAVDIVNDYASLAKPALLCTRPGGGTLVATNHAPQCVALRPFLALLACHARSRHVCTVTYHMCYGARVYVNPTGLASICDMLCTLGKPINTHIRYILTNLHNDLK